MMKKYTIIFWITVVLIFITQGIMPVLTLSNPDSNEVFKHLGYPRYFEVMLAIFKLTGGLILIIPPIPKRIKEWVFAGYGIDFICAAISFLVVDGTTGAIFLFPLISLLVLIICYISYHKKGNNNNIKKA